MVMGARVRVRVDIKVVVVEVVMWIKIKMCISLNVYIHISNFYTGTMYVLKTINETKYIKRKYKK